MKYAYINGKILDGTKDMQVKEGFVILTDNDKIEDIVKAGTDLNGYEKVDLKRRYIMPGLINMHVHLAGNGKPQEIVTAQLLKDVFKVEADEFICSNGMPALLPVDLVK